MVTKNEGNPTKGPSNAYAYFNGLTLNGSSGAPVFDKKGEVLGIIVAGGGNHGSSKYANKTGFLQMNRIAAESTFMRGAMVAKGLLNSIILH